MPYDPPKLESPMQGYQPRYGGWQYVADGSCYCDDCRDYRAWLRGEPKPGQDPQFYDATDEDYVRVFNEAVNIASNDGGLILKPSYDDLVKENVELGQQIDSLAQRNANQKETIMELEAEVKRLNKRLDLLQELQRCNDRQADTIRQCQEQAGKLYDTARGL